MLTDDIKDLEQKLKEKRSELARVQSNCQHAFFAPKYEAKETFTFIPDGIDFARSAGSDPEYKVRKQVSYSPQWSKTCAKCGLTKVTTKQKAVQTEPDFE